MLRKIYAPRLLEQKAQSIRCSTNDAAYQSKYWSSQSPGRRFLAAIIRPSKMLIRSPIVLILSLYMSTVYSYLYLMLTIFTGFFETVYGFNTAQARLAYLGLGIGFVIGQATLSWYLDWHLQNRQRNQGHATPEDRLPPLAVGALLIPVGLLWYGWTAQAHLHWIMPIFGTGLIGIGVLYAFLPIQLYLVDSFGIYAVSALAAKAVVRSLFGALVPLSGKRLYTSLGYGWGNSILAFIALAFVPAPFLLIRFGGWLRTHPRFQTKF